MRKIREVLRLRFAQGAAGQRAIGIRLRLSTGAVNTYLNRARREGLDWPLPDRAGRRATGDAAVSAPAGGGSRATAGAGLGRLFTEKMRRDRT